MIFNRTKHKELWTWLSENPGKLKEDWPGWGAVGPVDGNCFACEAINSTGRECSECGCVLDWGAPECTDKGTFYHEWEIYTAVLRSDANIENRSWYEKRAAYRAKIIANLPLREIEGLEVI